MNTGLLASRRDVLKGGALTVSFSWLGLPAQALAQNEPGSGKPIALNAVDSFLAIDAKGHVTVYSGKVDLGTGVETALAQIAADELDVPLEYVTVVQGDTALTPDQGPTFGSLSIQIGGVQIRNAAAVARNALLELASTKLGAKPDELKIVSGIISVGEKSVTYGELTGGKSFSLTVDHKMPPKTKDPKDFKVVGTSIHRLDIPAKVSGTFTYMQDFRVPDMLHGRVVRPPAIGAKLESVDEASISGIPGIVKIVREGNFLGVVAENEWAAIKASQKLKATWSQWEGLPEKAKLFDYVRATKVAKDEVTGSAGNTADAMGKAGIKKLSATYDFAIHTHGSIGPSCAIAEFKDGKLTLWTASQATHNLQKQLAKMFALPLENVRCIYVEGSGCYGRNGHEDAAADAALLAKAAGKPVRVQWSRADEHGWDPKGPPTLIDIRAAMDDSNTVTAWESEFFIPQQTPMNFQVPLLAATLSGLPADDVIAPGNIFQDSDIPYKIANRHIVCHRLESTPLRAAWIRTPGRMQNTFANESFMDELAAAAGADPIEFRLAYLDPSDKRGIEAINRAASLANWEKRPSPKPAETGEVLHGRGFSYVKYELARTYVAAVAEVEVQRATGTVRVTHFFVTHDCGQIINPDGLKNQIEGNVIQTVSRALIEDLQFDRSRVTSIDWVTYPILTFPQAPDIIIELIDRPNEKPWGAGEPSAAVIPSAISNAIFDAAGVRMRSVPFTPEKVKLSLSGAA
ncbi:MAG: molybdopterin cofactor-binding domain-containing protein [Rhodomicrobium sp.]|jgi:nicotinate dehydrogenase subunit B